MSVQPQCPSRVPSRVSVEILGQRVKAKVEQVSLKADAGAGPQHMLTIDVGSGRYRVPAADADPI